MIIVTGGAGFIGSNLVKGLNRRGRRDILVVDDLRDGRKFVNLVDCEIADYWDRDELEERFTSGRALPQTPDAVFHQGACSDTTQWDGRLMLDRNYRYSKMLLEYCRAHRISFIYASSAAVYGAGPVFKEAPEHEAPLNVYAFSKCLFDRYVSRHVDEIESQVVGLRYFNVYGPREQHKGAMASIAWQLRECLRSGEALRLFEGSDGYGDGEQRRDFVHVDDVVAVNLWFLDNPGCRGIFNVGTGRSQTFNDVANAVIGWYGKGRIEYVAFPASLAGRYQSFTEADIGKLRRAGFARELLGVEEGVRRYMSALDQR